MMSEDTTIATPENQGGDLPGGFESPQAMYDAFTKMKEDLSTHKTRAADVTAMQTKLGEYKAAEDARIDSERTELERVQAQVDALTQEVASANAATVSAQNGVLLERVLSTRLAGIDEAVRPLARRLYESAAVAGFADEESLTLLLEPVDEELKALQPSQNGGATVTMTSKSLPAGSRNTPAAEAAARDFLNLSYNDQARIAREKRR